MRQSLEGLAGTGTRTRGSGVEGALSSGVDPATEMRSFQNSDKPEQIVSIH